MPEGLWVNEAVLEIRLDLLDDRMLTMHLIGGHRVQHRGADGGEEPVT